MTNAGYAGDAIVIRTLGPGNIQRTAPPPCALPGRAKPFFPKACNLGFLILIVAADTGIRRRGIDPLRDL